MPGQLPSRSDPAMCVGVRDSVHFQLSGGESLRAARSKGGSCARRYTVNPALFDAAARFSVFPGLVRALLQIATLLKKAQGTAGLGEFDATKTGDD